MSDRRSERSASSSVAPLSRWLYWNPGRITEVFKRCPASSDGRFANDGDLVTCHPSDPGIGKQLTSQSLQLAKGLFALRRSLFMCVADIGERQKNLVMDNA
ncbi:hypothetical protein J2W42_002949 [Rhizobium tibeticum]|nr:hypothetical protein [Rhizobium tibeticum]